MDLNVDLNGMDEYFKEWFKIEIEKVLNMDTPNQNSIVYTSLNTNSAIDLETTSRIHNIIMADKAYDANQQNETNSGPDNIVRFLRESVYDLYMKHLDQNALNKLHERYSNGDYVDSNISEEIYSGLLDTISTYTKWLTHMTQKFPGFHKFDNEDLSVLVSSAALALYGFYFRNFYRNNENQLILNNNILYTRSKMNLLFDKTLIDLVFLYINKMHDLNLTECEVALFYPLILLSCDVKLIKSKEYLLDLKKYYINTLINEFKANNRDEKFSKQLVEFFKVSVVLELNKLNFVYKPNK